MKVFKITDTWRTSRHMTKWGRNVTHTADGQAMSLCNSHWLHAYQDKWLAMLMHPAHVGYTRIHLWEAEGTVGLTHPDKVGCTRLTTLKRCDMPAITLEQYVEFARLCALAVYHIWAPFDINKKAKAWLDNPYPHFAEAAILASAPPAYAYDAYTAYASAYAALIASSNIAYAATYAADAADYASSANRTLDLVAIAHKAVGIDPERKQA